MNSLQVPKKLTDLLGILVLLLSAFLLVKTAQSIETMASGEDWREITVEGEGTAIAMPDKASFSVGIYLEGDVSEELTLEAQKISTEVLTQLKALGIPEEDIATTSYDLSPRWDWSESAGSFQNGFTLSQYYEVTVKDIALVNEAVAAASSAGASNVGSVNFELDDDTDLMAEAREAAIAEARAKADQIEESSGLNLGKVVGYYEYDSNYYGKGYYPEYDTAYMEGASVEELGYAPNIEIGEKEVTLTVSLTFKVR